jgi:hypothetical protein
MASNRLHLAGESAANGQAKGCLAPNLVHACGLSALIK